MTYQDSLGVNYGGQRIYVKWHIHVDYAAVSSPVALRTMYSKENGYVMNRPMPIIGYIDNLPAGQHTISIYVTIEQATEAYSVRADYGNPGSPTSFLIEAEEIEF